MSAPTGSEECIHGLAIGACDVCSPKARPEPVKPVRAASGRGTRASASTRTAPVRPADVSARRIYHVTHLDNLPFIADSGAILAGVEPAFDLSAPGVRVARQHLPAPDGLTVGEHVPFFADLDSTVWAAIMNGDTDPRIATTAPASDFAILVTSLGAMPDALVSDGDAAHPLTRFASPESVPRMLAALARDTTGRAADAEVLVPRQVPTSALTIVTVANDRARRIARAANVGVRVAIHPPWFQPRTD